MYHIIPLELNCESYQSRPRTHHDDPAFKHIPADLWARCLEDKWGSADSQSQPISAWEQNARSRAFLRLNGVSKKKSQQPDLSPKSTLNFSQSKSACSQLGIASSLRLKTHMLTDATSTLWSSLSRRFAAF